MTTTRANLPAGHGELLLRPEFREWAALAASNREAADSWDFGVAGFAVQELRTQARREVLALAARFSERLGVPVRSSGADSDTIVLTGHQPELIHPGVWVKYFLLQRMADEYGVVPVGVVVDSDSFESVSLTTPCLSPHVRRCRQFLALGTPQTCYACAPVPAAEDVRSFCGAGDEMLATLPSPALRRHFNEFCGALREACSDAHDLGEAMTFARRRYEAPAGTDYLEVPVTGLAQGDAFGRFLVDVALDAKRFSGAYNDELATFRSVNGVRSNAQPFPDLETSDDRVELPFWVLSGQGRETLWVESSGEEVRLLSGDTTIAVLPRDAVSATHAFAASGARFAPKALTLTLFLRMFCGDLFIHGVGGGRYDAVTDGVCRRYYGCQPPGFAVASLTMYLPLGGHIVTDDEIAELKALLGRLVHNPDAFLGEMDFDADEQRDLAERLAGEKRHLVARIGAPDADKKGLGLRIREVNAELAALIAPLRSAYEAELASLEEQREASDVLTDRTYPYCLWSPQEIADKVR